MLFLTALALVGLTLRAPSTHGFGCGAPACAPACAPTVQYVEKTITVCRPVWQERDVPCTVNRVVSRVEVVPVRSVVMVPEFKTETRTIFVSRPVCKPVERVVYSVHYMPCQTACASGCASGCGTGCHSDVCDRRVPVVTSHKVTSMVTEWAAEARQVTVPVCTFRAEERVTQTQRVVCQVVPETVVRKERYCVMVPQQVTVRVPVCVPAPCNTGCCH